MDADVFELRLEYPKLCHMREALDYRKEFADRGEAHIPGGGGLGRAESYEVWLRGVTAMRSRPEPGWVACSTFFALVGERIVGTVQIRHELNGTLMISGGHIGYGVRPSERRKGYATAMLAAALVNCRALGIKSALVTCDRSNVGSARTIEKNGGVFENELTEEDGTAVRRYWVPCE